MKKILFSLLYSSLIIRGIAQDEINYPDISEVIDDLVVSDKKLDFKGSVLIAKGDQIMHHKNYGLDRSRDYSFWIGSLSKQFCAAAILRLQDEGLLSVSDPISKFIEVPEPWQSITLHQLLTHTSGLPDNYAADGISNQKEALNALLANKVDPSKKYSYSNDGYQLLAILIEMISGKTYDEFLQEVFFQPLEMTATGISGDGKKWGLLNIPSSRKSKDSSPQDWSSNYGYKGSTGILSSTGDLMKWKKALFSNQVLSDKATSLLFTKHVQKTEEVFYGYGWNVFDTSNGEIIVHSGADDFIDHNSTFRHYKDKDVTIIVLSNDGIHKGTEKSRVIASKLIPILFSR